MAVNDVNSSTSATSSTSSTGTTRQTEDIQGRFLSLLVAQFRNQDPLNPLDNAQVTSQMAQINTVGGIEKLNQSMTAMMETFQGNQALQAAGLVGRGVLVDGDKIDLSQRAGVGGFELAGPADAVTIKVLDAKGNVVKTIDLGKQPEGVSSFNWDGTNDAGGVAPDGKYTFKVEAQRGGQKVENIALAYGAVNSVAFSNQGLVVEVRGLGSRPINEIRQVRG